MIRPLLAPSRRASLFLAWALAAGTATLSWAATPATVEVAEELQAIVARDAAATSVRHGFAQYRPALERFYATRNFVPAWTVDGQPTHQADEAVALLQRADEQGLASVDYQALDLGRRLADLRGSTAQASGRELAVFDADLTLSLVRYTLNLAHGRLDPASRYPDLEDNVRDVDAVALLQRGLENDRLAAEIESAAPRLPPYDRLTQALAAYRRLAADASLPLVPIPPTKVSPGAIFTGLPQLKERLVAFGDLDPAALKQRNGNRYAGAVVDAVKRFQYRHGLADDGVLGQSTLAELNRSPGERVRQIEIALERMRWLPPLPDGRFLVVNIPEFRLLAFDTSTSAVNPVLDMPVIVGQAGKTPTPVFAAEVEYLDFSPYWNVPRSIAVKELLPKLKADPAYLSRQGMEIVGNGVRTEINAATLSDLERGALRLRQRPGAKNALGGVKFVFPNRHDVYLHSTPTPKLFSRTRRDFSHGCIRVAEPVALAQFLLADRPAWDADRIRTSMSRPQPLRVNLAEPVPILILYTTVVVDAVGRIRFLPDIYGHDTKLAQALAAPLPAAHRTPPTAPDARGAISL
jgi:murein L,D-transpeptidase YcbB/YkuD